MIVAAERACPEPKLACGADGEEQCAPANHADTIKKDRSNEDFGGKKVMFLVTSEENLRWRSEQTPLCQDYAARSEETSERSQLAASHARVFRRSGPQPNRRRSLGKTHQAFLVPGRRRDPPGIGGIGPT